MEINTMAFIWGFLFDAVTSLHLGWQQWNMCYMDCQKHPSHTICRPPKSSCRVRMHGVDAAARSEILRVHNDYRSQVALGKLDRYPPAADMQELLWDDDLARVAQAWAQQCERKHDPGIDRCTRRFQAVGQNLGATLTQDVSGTNWPGIITAWFEEYKIYRPQWVKAFRVVPGQKVGHFAQAIWAKTRYVGCGFAYVYGTQPGWPHSRFYACNYAPAGNELTSPIYQEGRTCSACPESTRCTPATGLCGDPSSSGGGSDGHGSGHGDGSSRDDAGRGDSGGSGEDRGANGASTSWLTLLTPFFLGMMIAVGGFAIIWWIRKRQRRAADAQAVLDGAANQPLGTGEQPTTTSTATFTVTQ